MIASIAPRIPPASGDGLADALSDVMEAFSASTAEQLLRIEERLANRLRASVSLLVIWGAALAATTIAWFCACAALGLALMTAFGGIVAVVVLAALHTVIAGAFLRAARPRAARWSP